MYDLYDIYDIYELYDLYSDLLVALCSPSRLLMYLDVRDYSRRLFGNVWGRRASPSLYHPWLRLRTSCPSWRVSHGDQDIASNQPSSRLLSPCHKYPKNPAPRELDMQWQYDKFDTSAKVILSIVTFFIVFPQMLSFMCNSQVLEERHDL